MSSNGYRARKKSPKGNKCAACDGFLGASDAGCHLGDGIVLCEGCAPPASRCRTRAADNPAPTA